MWTCQVQKGEMFDEEGGGEAGCSVRTKARYFPLSHLNLSVLPVLVSGKVTNICTASHYPGDPLLVACGCPLTSLTKGCAIRRKSAFLMLPSVPVLSLFFLAPLPPITLTAFSFLSISHLFCWGRSIMKAGTRPLSFATEPAGSGIACDTPSMFVVPHEVLAELRLDFFF